MRASANNHSLFAERRIVEIRMPTGKPGNTGSAAIIALLEARDRDRVLVITAPKLDRDAQGSEWVRAVETHGALVAGVARGNIPASSAGCGVRAKRLRLDIDDDALEVIAERTEGNLLAADQELQKLRMIVRADRVTVEDVLASVADSARFDVFQLGECALAGDTSRALRMIEGLRGRRRGAHAGAVVAEQVRSRPVGRDSCGVRRPAAGLAPPDRGARAGPEARLRAAFRPLTARAVRADRMIKGRGVRRCVG
ncbi:MAG: DNA polymerase III subunit delta [Gammaproteobacteria bacterium]